MILERQDGKEVPGTPFFLKLMLQSAMIGLNRMKLAVYWLADVNIR